MQQIAEILEKKGINPTPIRMLVYKCLKDSQNPLSLTDIETRLDTVDKSSVSRALNIFKEHNVLHSFNDGSGSVKYEICHNENFDDHADRHVHFRCIACGTTICLTSSKVPEVELPAGYEVIDINYVISGICPECMKK